jgi:hypothetical protein
VGIFDRALSRIGSEPPDWALCGWAGLCLALLSALRYRSEALDRAAAEGWIIVDMKTDWKSVFPD